MSVSSLPKRKTSEQGDIKKLILQTAATAFAEHGFSGTSLRDIGKTAGINFQSIRYHFGTKEGLWESVVEDLSLKGQEAGVHHEQALAGLPLHELLNAQIRALISYQVANPSLNKILMREAIKNSKRYRRVYSKHVKRFHELTESFLSKMQKHGVIKKDIPIKDLVFVLHGALNYRLIAIADSEIYTGEKVNTEDVINHHANAITKLLLA